MRRDYAPITAPPNAPDIEEFQEWYRHRFGKDYDFALQYDAFQAWDAQTERINALLEQVTYLQKVAEQMHDSTDVRVDRDCWTDQKQHVSCHNTGFEAGCMYPELAEFVRESQP